MVQFDNQYKQIKIKIVYYGPALGGKTTCLQYIHRATDPQRRTRLYALSTASDRTLFFDLLALDLGRVRGYRLTLQLFTVPGQVQYNATRRAVLAGADGVVFVADSQQSQGAANEESLVNLAENLRANGLDPDTVPIVFQFNKRDLPTLIGRATLDAALNPAGHPAFETVATTGKGVMESFAAITGATVRSVGDRLGLGGQTDSLKRLLGNVKAAFSPFLTEQEVEERDAPVVYKPAAPSAEGNLDADQLVGEAVRANVAMVELNSQLDRTTRELEHRVRQLRFINEFGRLMSMAREPEEVTGGLLERVLAELGAANGSLIVAGEGGLTELVRRGLAADPLMRDDTDGRPAAERLLASRQPLLASLEEMEPSQLMASPWIGELRELGFVSAIAVPLVAQDRPIALVTAYADEARGPFESEDLELVTALAANAAVALANARAWHRLERANESLEAKVAARTRELEETLHRVEAMAAALEERTVLLEGANRQLREIERLKGDLLHRIAHEFNTPVTAIQTAARILTRYEEVPADRAAKFVGIINEEASRLAGLIAASLQAVVLSAPDEAAAPAPVKVAELVKRVLASLRAEIAQRSLKVRVKVASGLDVITGDERQLEAALRAIVKNAVEFNAEGGDITVVVQSVRQGRAVMAEIRVEDTGAGIPPEDLEHVCEVFWQGGNVLTGKPQGVGLGLAVARRVAENHEGRLEVVSEPGAGTKVSLYLPLRQAGG